MSSLTNRQFVSFYRTIDTHEFDANSFTRSSAPPPNSNVIQLPVDKSWRRQLYSARGRPSEFRTNYSGKNQCNHAIGIGQMQSKYRFEAFAFSFALAGRRSSSTGGTIKSSRRSNVAERLRHVPSNFRRSRQFAICRTPSPPSAHHSTASSARFTVS